MRVNPPSTPQVLYSTKKTHHSTVAVHSSRQKNVLNSKVKIHPEIHPHLIDNNFWEIYWRDLPLSFKGQKLIQKFCIDLNLDKPTIDLIKLILSNSELDSSQIETLLNSRERIERAKDLAVQTKSRDRKVQTITRGTGEESIEGQYSVNALLVGLLEVTFNHRLSIPRNTDNLNLSNFTILKTKTPLKAFREFYAAMYTLEKNIVRKKSRFAFASEEQTKELESLQAVREIFREPFSTVQIYSIYQAFYRKIYSTFVEKLFTKEMLQEKILQKELLEKGIILGSEEEKTIETLKNFKLENVTASLRHDYQMARQMFLLVCFQNESPSSFDGIIAPSLLPAPLRLIELIRKLCTIDVSRIDAEVINEINNSLKEMNIMEITSPGASHLNQALYYATCAKCNFLLSLQDPSNSPQLLEETQKYLQEFEMLKTRKSHYPESIKTAEEFINFLIRRWGVAPAADRHNPTFGQMSVAYGNSEDVTSPISSPINTVVLPRLAREEKTEIQHHKRTKITHSRFRTLRGKPFQLMEEAIELILCLGGTEAEIQNIYEQTWILAIKHDLALLTKEYYSLEFPKRSHSDEYYRNFEKGRLLVHAINNPLEEIDEKAIKAAALKDWQYGFLKHFYDWKKSSDWTDSPILSELKRQQVSNSTINKVALLRWKGNLDLLKLIFLGFHKETIMTARIPYLYIDKGLALNHITQTARTFNIDVSITQDSSEKVTMTFFVKNTNETITLTPQQIIITSRNTTQS